MIDIAAVNRQLAEQDESLRATLTSVTARAIDEPAMKAVVDVLIAGLCAIHERQGNLITLMLQRTPESSLSWSERGCPTSSC